MHYRGPQPDVDIPDCTLYDLFFASMDEEVAQKIAFDHAETGTVVTFGELKQQVDAFATWLGQRGIGQGAAVAVMLTNRPEYASAFHGIMRSGAAVAPVNVMGSPAEIARHLQLTDCTMVVTQAQLAESARAAADLVGLGPESVIVMDRGDGQADMLDWRDVMATPVDLPVLDLNPATDVACLPVSSGTSGLPKAVMLSHRNLVANMLQFDWVLAPLGYDHQFVAFLPYSHIFALTTILNYSLYRRFPQYTMSHFDARLFFEIIETRRPSVAFVVPPVAAFLARHPAALNVDWSSVKLLVSGAAAMDGKVAAALQERFDLRVIQGYGMTEMSPVSHIMPVDRPDLPLDSVGPPVASATIRVVDPETGQDVPVPAPGEWSQPGELWVSGPNIMLGYLRQTEETDAIRDAEGWIHTGDLVQVDRDGVTRVVDRIKELIKHRGFQVAPVELEHHLMEHPEVIDAAVLGRPRPSGDQVPHALLVLREGADPSVAKEVVQWLNHQVAQYKHLGGATVVAEIPRSAAGKILRRQLPALVDA
ncbi:AMP-binding protein [Luteococcus sp. Sow4_B9]|uniref:AMP-binding protein n=1 Tax=Luteococcus sp. Sow4_B9 TaxID=3438792 RepID=UPI003F99CBCF